jgi:hypothetical protein
MICRDKNGPGLEISNRNREIFWPSGGGLQGKVRKHGKLSRTTQVQFPPKLNLKITCLDMDDGAGVGI